MILFLHLFSINFLVFIFLILLLAEQSLILPVIAKAIKTRRGNIPGHNPSSITGISSEQLPCS